MPHLLLNFRHVPDDEIIEVRELLEEEGIDYYETPPSRWGVSMGGIWTRDRAMAERARTLLEDYQAQRLQRSRADYEQRSRSGEVMGFWQRLRARPVAVLGVCLAIAAVIYLSLVPFLGWGD
ncbi:DUF6164 family protein [Marinobacteraceae bacterium S3BR75-40.1]